MNRIIALVDASSYGQSVCDHAAWVSGKTGFGIDVLHVVRHRPGRSGPFNLAGNLTLGARTELLETLTRHDEETARLARERARLVTESAKARLEQAGAHDIHVRLRNGDLLDAVREVEDEARLLVIGKRGEHADFASKHLGSNLERVVRSAHRPVLVAARAFTPPQAAVIAFDTGASVAKAVDHIAKGKLLTGMTLHLLHAGEGGAELDRAIGSAAQRLREAGHQVETEVRSGDPDEVIAGYIKETGANLLVMGAYGHSRVRNLLVGSTTTQMVRACLVPVLLFRPDTVEDASR